MNNSQHQSTPAKKASNTRPQVSIPQPNKKELIRIRQIVQELEDLQRKQNALIAELGELAPEEDPAGIEWIYPDPIQNRTKSRQA